MPSGVDPTGVLVIRVWHNPDTGLCARLLEGGSPEVSGSTWATCTGTAATLKAVEGWLEHWCAGAGQARTRDGPAPPDVERAVREDAEHVNPSEPT